MLALLLFIELWADPSSVDTGEITRFELKEDKYK